MGHVRGKDLTLVNPESILLEHLSRTLVGRIGLEPMLNGRKPCLLAAIGAPLELSANIRQLKLGEADGIRTRDLLLERQPT